MTRFVDSFWDTDFTSSNGYDILVKRMKDGREMCKDFEEFLKQRAKAEETFGRTLTKISKSSGGKDEIGTLKTAWNEVVSQTEVSATSHTNIAVRLNDEAKKVEEFREAQKERRRKAEDAIKKVMSAKREQYNRVMHSKRAYESKCKEYDICEDAFAKNSLTLPPKELEKASQKKEKLKQAATAADAQYQKDVATLEQTRKQWEEQMIQVCVIFQQLEMERICFLRNAMWVFANIISLQCVFDDKNCEEMRRVLSDCNEEKDIQFFISQKSTGGTRPAPVVYECYYKDGAVGKAACGISNGRARQTLPPLPGVSRIEQRALPSPPQTSPPPADGIYSTMAEYSTGIIGESIKPSSNKYMAKYDYEAQGEQELSITTGDILIILHKEDSTWWYAQANGKKGHVPAEYLGPYAETGEEAQITFL